MYLSVQSSGYWFKKYEITTIDLKTTNPYLPDKYNIVRMIEQTFDIKNSTALLSARFEYCANFEPKHFRLGTITEYSL